MDGGMMTIRSSRGRRHADRGASLVEFAIILPVFAMLIFGMISAGLALNDKQQITHATREGARFGATVPAGQTFASGTWASNVRQLIVDRSTGALTTGDVCVSLVEGSGATLTVVNGSSNYSTSGSSPCIPGQTYPVTSNDAGRRVQVTAAKPAEINLALFGKQTIQINVDATARSESNT